MGEKLWNILKSKGVTNLYSVSDLSGIDSVGIGSLSELFSLATSNIRTTRKFEYIIPSAAIKPILSIHRAINIDFKKKTQMLSSFQDGLNKGLKLLLKIESNNNLPAYSKSSLEGPDLQVKRIQQLITIINDISWDQNYKAAKCDIPNDDPFRNLFGAFYELQQEIGRIINEVAKHNENLEIQVKERTERLINQIRKTHALNVQLDRFVYSASHELRAPISSQLGLINLMEMEKKQTNKRKYLALFKETVHKQDDILRQILRIRENNRSIVKRDKIEFTRILTDVLHDLGFDDEIKAVHIMEKIEQNGPFFTDKTRLKIILSNLLKNAYKYSTQKRIQICIKNLPNYYAEFRVIDFGQGISQEVLPYIFDVFYKGSEKKSGSGIGLFMVKEMVNSLAGSIEVNTIVKLPCLRAHTFNDMELA